MSPVLLLLLAGCPPKIDVGPVPVEVAAAPAVVVTLPDPSAPNVYLQALIRSGSANDPSGKEGLAHLMAKSMIAGGAGERTPTEVDALLFPMGTALEVYVDREWTSLRLTCHVDLAEPCLALFTDVLVRPGFQDAEVTRLRDEAVYTLTTGVMGDEEALGIEVWDSWLHEAHPYGHPVEGRTGVLPLLDTAQVRRFHASHVVREAVTVGLGGAYSDAQLTALNEALLGLPTTRMPELPLQKPLPVQGRHLLMVDTNTPVTGFSLGHSLAVDRSHPDYPALVLAMTAFGAHRQSFGRLFNSLRTDRGLNYGTYAYAEPFTQRGWTDQPENAVLRRQPHFRMWVRPTSEDNGPFALKLALWELERLVADGLTEEELEATKAYLQKGVGLQARDPGRRLAYALDARANGTPDPLTTLPERLETVTTDDVRRVLQAWIQPDDLRIVGVSGDAEGTLQRLVEESDTPIVYADVEPTQPQAELDATVAAIQLGIAPTNAHTVEAEGIFR